MLCENLQRVENAPYELQVLYYAVAYLDDQNNLHVTYMGGAVAWAAGV